MLLSVTEQADGITGLEEAEALWRANIPCETVFDLWEVRMAFQRHYRRPFRFLIYGDTSSEKQLLPLSWVEEKGAWCFFPGEAWNNKTWLEQNRLVCKEIDREQLKNRLGADFHLRYLNPDGAASVCPVDETGYLFCPPQYDYRIENWWNSFSHKRGKLLRRELAALEKAGVEIRHNEKDRFDLMVEMNLGRFGATSYFSDTRFREGFRDMLAVLDKMGFLRVTTLYSGGSVAAIDFGSVFKGRYTLLAGGTDARFPGVAKLINLHHLEWSCENRMDEVDFSAVTLPGNRCFILLLDRCIFLVPERRITKGESPFQETAKINLSPFACSMIKYAVRTISKTGI